MPARSTPEDMDSIGDFSNISVNDAGFLKSADADINFRTEFSIQCLDSLLLEVGLRYNSATCT